jgi:hypothetical protein
MTDAESTLAQRPPLRLEPSSKYPLRCAILSVIFILMGLHLMMMLDQPVMGMLTVALFGLVLYGSLQMQAKGSYYLSLGSEGFTLHMAKQSLDVSWADVKSIRATWMPTEQIQISWNQVVRVDRVVHTPTPLQRLTNMCELWLYPRPFGMNAKQLVATMTPYFEDARRKSEIPTSN